MNRRAADDQQGQEPASVKGRQRRRGAAEQVASYDTEQREKKNADYGTRQKQGQQMVFRTGP